MAQRKPSLPLHAINYLAPCRNSPQQDRLAGLAVEQPAGPSAGWDFAPHVDEVPRESLVICVWRLGSCFAPLQPRLVQPENPPPPAMRDAPHNLPFWPPDWSMPEWHRDPQAVSPLPLPAGALLFPSW